MGKERAALTVPSAEPSSTIMISKERGGLSEERRCCNVVRSIGGRRRASLYAGITTERSKSAMSLSDGRG